MVSRVVCLSFSRPARGAIISMDCMRAARSTAGPLPTAAAKKAIRAMVITAVRRRPRPSTRLRKPAR